MAAPVPALPPAPANPLDSLKALVLDALPSAESKRAYGRALDRFLAWAQAAPSPGTFNKALVQQYREHLRASGLSPSAVNLQMTAVRRLAAEAADNGLLDPTLASGVGRVKGIRREGLRLGNWLTLAQAEKLLQVPDPATVKGKRDRALLAVLLGTGLRREEAAKLTFEQIQQREGRWVLVDLRGKGGRVRSVPMPSWTKAALDEWAAAVGLTTGRIFRPINKGDRVSGEKMTAQAIFNTVKHYAGKTGLESIAPHDLRRSFAKLAHKGKAPLEQIQLSLGHASVQTTERYLGVQQDLHDAPCDHLGLRFSAS